MLLKIIINHLLRVELEMDNYYIVSLKAVSR